jgi:hypothetical protein
MFIEELLTMVKIWNQTRCPSVNKWMVDIDTIECYSDIRKNEILSFVATWTEVKNIAWSEISQNGTVGNRDGEGQSVLPKHSTYA